MVVKIKLAKNKRVKKIEETRHEGGERRNGSKKKRKQMRVVELTCGRWNEIASTPMENEMKFDADVGGWRGWMGGWMGGFGGN